MQTIHDLHRPQCTTEDTWKRFKERVEVSGECWVWTGNGPNSKYGHIQRVYTTVGVHRQMYEWFVGNIPEGITVNHICNIPRCVRPDHLNLKTRGDNVREGPNNNAKKETCPKGHPYDKVNSQGKRVCTKCMRVTTLRSQHRKAPWRCKEGCACREE